MKITLTVEHKVPPATTLFILAVFEIARFLNLKGFEIARYLTLNVFEIAIFLKDFVAYLIEYSTVPFL